MHGPVITRLDRCIEITAGDGCRLRELLHPERQSVTARFSLAWARVEPGEATIDHWLDQSETYYILAGEGELFVDGHPYPVRAGACCFIPPGARQRIANRGDGPLDFLCIVDPPWSEQGDHATRPGEA